MNNEWIWKLNLINENWDFGFCDCGIEDISH